MLITIIGNESKKSHVEKVALCKNRSLVGHWEEGQPKSLGTC